MADIKEKDVIYQYNVNHDAEWLAGVCRSMITPFGKAKDREFERGWDRCLHCVITIIEECMIPPESEDKK